MQHNATGFRQGLIERKCFRIVMISTKLRIRNISSNILTVDLSEFMLKKKSFVRYDKEHS